MNRTRLLAGLTAARAGPDDVLYLERLGEDYRWRLTAPGDAAMNPAPGPGEAVPDAWIFYCGPWPSGGPAAMPAFVDELLAELDSMCGGADRCRWPLDQPYPLRH
jgi:hypothetical protein